MGNKKAKKLLSDAEEIKARNIKHKELYGFINTHIAFIVHKVTGITLISTGALEFYDPNILSVVVSEPLVMSGVGLGFLTGKHVFDKVLKLLGKA